MTTKKLLQSLAVVCLLAGLGQAQNGNQGTLIASSTDCTTAGSCVSVKFDQPAAVGGSTVSLSGSFTATVQFEASNDGKALSDSTKTWVAINGTPANGTVAVTSATTANTWQFNVAGYTDIRARASAWTSAPTVVIRSTLTSAKSGGGAVFASGGTTNNVIPKSNGSSALADSSITDNGTNVSTTEMILVPATSSATVAGGIGSSTSLGINFSTQIQFINAGARNFAINGTVLSGGSGGTFCWSNSSGDALGSGCNVGVSSGGAGVVDIGTGAAASAAGTANLATIQYRGLAQTTFVTSDFTTSGVGTALEAITGLTWTFPASTAINARIDCNILYLQNVANVAVAFGFQDATVAPTNLAASGIQYTSATASTEGTLAASATTTATAVTSATPSAITTIWHAQLHFLIEQPSNASTSVFTIRTSTATAGDTVTVKRGSYCSLAQ